MKKLTVFKIEQINEFQKYLYKCSRNKICTIETFKIEEFLRKRKINFEYISTLSDENNNTNDNTCKESDNILVVISENEIIQLISKYFAYITKKNMIIMGVKEFRQYIISDALIDTSICILTEQTYIEDIQNVLFMNKNTLRCGIIWGQDENELLYLVNKNIVTYYDAISKTIAVDRTDKKNMEIQIKNDQYIYLPYASAHKNDILQSISDKAEIFAFTGHGRDELLWLTKGVICGGSKSCFEQHKPSCYADNRCFKNDVEILNIKDLNITNYFIDACSSGNMVNPVFGNSYGILQNFMKEMGVTYISSPYICNECEAMIHYYTAMVAVGMTFGEIVLRLNKYYSEYKIGNNNSFFLVGDPDVRLRPLYSEKVIELEDESMPISYTLKVEENTTLLVIKARGLLYDDFISLKTEIIVQNNSRQNLYAHIYNSSNENQTYICVFAKGMLDKEEYFITIRNRNSVRIDTFYNLTYIYELGLIEPKYKRYFEESIKSLKNFNIRKYNGMCQISHIGSIVYNKYDKIVNRINKIDNQLNNSIWKKIHKFGWTLDELCLNMGFRNKSKKLTKRKCPYCKGTLCENHIYNELYLINRTHVFCNKCGNIEDKPDDIRIEARFEKGDIVLYKKGTNIIVLNIKNISREKITGYVSIAIVNGESSGFRYIPEEMKVVLHSQEIKEISFTIDQNYDIPSHNYWLMGILSFETEIQVIKRDIFYE